MFERVKAVIFDMDGTLVDSMGMWREIDRNFLAKRGIPVPEDIQQAIEGKSFTETAVYFKKRFQLSESVEEIIAEWIEMSKNYYEHQIPLKPGVRRLVEYLYKKGYKIGLATSGQRQLVEVVLRRHRLKSYFQSIWTSCEVGKGKPHPDIFLKVAEDLGVKPAECLVFEDTLAGVLAGKRAGMRVVAVYDAYSVPQMEKIREVADKYIESFEEIA
ncbi:HAD family hydrolase [Anoxybacter fermentans]|uniref:HAD family hydrolase n=1 Tax=Anoxybacter fermentans TaxID=1323375 RepID=A0A3Q9HRG0_9FIRM|nr:HAD family phosphatase [Anoxybacter fermentans]AZR73650.1 HAD family hydrolase [Anoxybacter fermentans]